MDPFDVAIVGAGSSGCALAGRLAARSRLRIALIEAGPDYGQLTRGRWPADLLDAHRTPDSHDWGFAQSRARVLAGCSAHNECGIVRALPGDYDRWSSPGWANADLAPVVAEVADSLPIRICRDELASWQRVFLETAAATGFARLADVNDAPGRPGVASFAQNIKDGVRWNAAFAFLDAARSRLTIISDTLADRLVLEGGHARALVAHGPGGRREIPAERFVLCAGVYGSPSILLRSGIGPASHLADLGIPLQHDLPGVGANLHDHPGVGFGFEPAVAIRRALEEDLAAGRFYQSQAVLKAVPALHLFPYQAKDRGDDDWSFTIFAYYLSPRSRGRLRLTGRDPHEPPAIDLGLLSDPDGHDVGALVKGVQLIERLTQQQPLAASIRGTGPRFASDHQRAAYVRKNVTDYAHSVGTCRMGPSPSTGDVVAADTTVHGLANVSVADAAIMPIVPHANTNFTCFVIGARAADLIARSSPR